MFKRRGFFRRPNLKSRITSRLSPKRHLRHNLGLKAPRGLGWITNPRRALYNRIYHRTSARGCLWIPGLLLAAAAAIHQML